MHQVSTLSPNLGEDQEHWRFCAPPVWPCTPGKRHLLRPSPPKKPPDRAYFGNPYAPFHGGGDQPALPPPDCIHPTFTKAQIPANMATASVGYSFHTPGLDQASIGTGHEFPFPVSAAGLANSEFLDKTYGMESGMKESDTFGFDSFGPESQPYPFDFEQQPYPPSLTPPGASDQLDSIRSQVPTLQLIETSYPLHHARLQNGQFTPPDDEAPPDSKLSSPVPHIKSELTHVHEIPAAAQSNAPKRRKSSTNDQSQAGPKKRKPRKNNAASVSPSEDLDPVEDDKRNKFLERNRVAASKCRQKKKEWTQSLEYQARELAKRKQEMQYLVDGLKEEVMWLKSEMLKHDSCGDPHITAYLAHQAKTIASGGRSPTSAGGPNSPDQAVHSPRMSLAEHSVTDWDMDRRHSISDESVHSIDSKMIEPVSFKQEVEQT